MFETVETFDEWENFLKNGFEYTVTLFTVPWCGSCKMMAKKLKVFSEENKEENIQYTVIDADQIVEVKSLYGISQYPCFIFFKNSEKKHKFATSRFEHFTDEFTLNLLK